MQEQCLQVGLTCTILEIVFQRATTVYVILVALASQSSQVYRFNMIVINPLREMEKGETTQNKKLPQCRFCVVLNMTGKVASRMDPFLHTNQHKVNGTTQNKLPQCRILRGSGSANRIDMGLSLFQTIIPQWVPWFAEFWIQSSGQDPLLEMLTLLAIATQKLPGC